MERLVNAGTGLAAVERVANRGSGNIPEAAFSDGVVEVSPASPERDPSPFTGGC